jgi:rhamnogalacturonan endolyase
MLFLLKAATVLALGQTAYAAFGLTSTSSKYTVDTDGGLVFDVSRYMIRSKALLAFL